MVMTQCSTRFFDKKNNHNCFHEWDWEGGKGRVLWGDLWRRKREGGTPEEMESFGLILQNRKLICIIGTVQSYLGFWGERLNFGITVAEIQPKVWERRRKRWREKMLNFGNGDTEFPLPNSAACARSAWSVKEKIFKRKLTSELWQCHCRNKGVKKKILGNCGNPIAENGKKKNSLRQW